MYKIENSTSERKLLLLQLNFVNSIQQMCMRSTGRHQVEASASEMIDSVVVLLEDAPIRKVWYAGSLFISCPEQQLPMQTDMHFQPSNCNVSHSSLDLDRSISRLFVDPISTREFAYLVTSVHLLFLQ